LFQARTFALDGERRSAAETFVRMRDSVTAALEHAACAARQAAACAVESPE
jgi:hypothetical protein